MRVYDPSNPSPRVDKPLFPEDVPDVFTAARDLLRILEKDRDKLQEADDYLHGIQADPYMPDDADAEYRLLAERSKTNYMPLVITAVAQQMYVDSFRAGKDAKDHESKSWKHWQRSGLDARQHPLYRASFTYGHAFTVTELEDIKKKQSRTRALSPRKTAALFEDAANDLVPYAALTIHRPERTVEKSDGKSESVPGTALLWTETNKYRLSFKGCEIVGGIEDLGLHGSTSCPVTRFPCDVDLDGRTTGLVTPLIPLQDRINQSVFDLLVAQTGGSFKVRTISGMVPPTMRRPVWQTDPETDELILDEDGQPVLDHFVDVIDPATGNPVPQPIKNNAKRFLFAEDPDTKFGQLDETPLGGYIESIDMSIRHLSSVTQMPPDYLLGQVANLSAEALQAAERALSRKVAEFQSQFGEAWERVFRVAAELEGDTTAADDESAEVLWRDLDKASLSRVADALGKLRTNLSIPAEGLWEMVPAVTQGQIERWKQLMEEADPTGQLTKAINAAIPPQQNNSFGNDNTEEDLNREDEEVANGAASSPPPRDS